MEIYRSVPSHTSGQLADERRTGGGRSSSYYSRQRRGRGCDDRPTIPPKWGAIHRTRGILRTCGRTLRQQQAARSTTTTITSHRHQCPSRMPPSPSFYLRGRNANRARFRSICMPSRGGNLGARRGLQLAGRRIWRRDRFRPDYSRSARAARRRQVPPGRLRLSHYLRASRFGQGACCVLGRAQQPRLTPFASLT